MPSQVDSRAILTVSALMLVIGVLIGAIGMAVSSPTPDTESPRAESHPGQQAPLPIDNGLAVLPANISKEDAKLIRDFLKKELHDGKWTETEWKRVDAPAGESIDFHGLGLSKESYGIDLDYSSLARSGASVDKTLHVVFHHDGTITAFGLPVPRGTFKQLKR